MIRPLLVAAAIAATGVHNVDQLVEIGGDLWHWSGTTTYFVYAGPAHPATAPPHKSAQAAPPPKPPDPAPLLREASRLLRLAAIRLDTGKASEAANVKPAIEEAQRLVSDAVKGQK